MGEILRQAETELSFDRSDRFGREAGCAVNDGILVPDLLPGIQQREELRTQFHHCPACC